MNAKAVKKATAAPSDPAASSEKLAKPDSVPGDYDETSTMSRRRGRAARVGIADPLEPFNRAMYHFNDKLYFWVLKPVAQGYKAVVPEFARIGCEQFLHQYRLSRPVRQLPAPGEFRWCSRGSSAGSRSTRSGGSAGFSDPASREDVGSPEAGRGLRADAGSLRDRAGVLHQLADIGTFQPAGYARDQSVTTSSSDLLLRRSLADHGGLRACDKVNDVSLRIGDYESLKEAAIDPYVAIRDAYVQYRLNKVKDKGGQPSPSTGVEKPRLTPDGGCFSGFIARSPG